MPKGIEIFPASTVREAAGVGVVRRKATGGGERNE